MELATNADKAAKFVAGIVPSDIDTSKVKLPDEIDKTIEELKK